MKSRTLLFFCATAVVITGCASTSSPSAPTIYPLKFTSSLEDQITEMPKTCYYTPAEENGLSGNVYSVTGTVKSVLSEDETVADVGEMFSIENEEGTVWFVVADPEFLSGGGDASTVEELMDGTMDYTLPDENEYVTVYGIYSGYSDTYEAPLLYFGIDEFVYDIVNGSNSDESETQEEINTDESQDAVLSDWDSVTNGENSNEWIYIDGIVDNYSETSTGMDFNMFFKSGNGYEMLKMYPGEDACEYLIEKYPEGIENGDVLRMTQKIGEDPLVGQGFIEADKIDSVSIDEVHQEYEKSCPELDYESIIRKPVGTFSEDIKCKFTGEIIQIVNEGGEFGKPDYLIKSGDNIVYCTFDRSFENREMRFVEGDNVTIYGNCNALSTYDTIIGQNTVPSIWAFLIELN